MAPRWPTRPGTSIPALVAFDPDGRTNNARDIILAGNAVLCYDATQKTFSSGYKGLSTTASMPVYALAAAADLNYHNRDELITLSSTPGVGCEGDMPLWGDTLAETGKGAVIYNGIPFDVYSYKILSAPNTASIGSTMTVDFPREPQVIQMERTAFNALPDNTLAVGGGVSVDASVEFTVLGALFGVDMGFSDEFSYTVKTTTSTELSGSVPGTLSGSSFTFGIAGYNLTDTSFQKAPFMVVTYWVN
jgi:hypothetical protein